MTEHTGCCQNRVLLREGEPELRVVPAAAHAPIVVVIELPQSLTVRTAMHTKQLARQAIADISGAPYCVLVDARPVLRADAEAPAIVAELEEELVRSRLLVRIARVVKSAELAKLANEEAAGLGFGEHTRTFVETEAALAFLTARAEGIDEESEVEA